MKKRISAVENDPLYNILLPEERDFLAAVAEEYYLSFQDLKKLITLGLDFASWEAGSIRDLWETPPASLKGKNRKQWSLNRITGRWKELKEASPDYADNSLPGNPSGRPARASTAEMSGPEPGLALDIPEEDTTLMGRCPVASEKTRCCNLHTLDAVQNCGYNCSYCTIQSFYNGNAIHFHRGLKEKLKKLDLDPVTTYHIGTGQSSDSLMWGNQYGVLEELFSFTAKHPNLILELKTKSANVGYLLENPPPPNVLATWSLNTETIIRNEERGTASLDERLHAARKAADAGILVGFHFHPMVRYKGWENEYRNLFTRLLAEFSPEEVALTSFGTLTYIKPVLKTIRSRGEKTKILQMPMEDIAGKSSYPFDMKIEMFQTAYQSLAPWHEKVFFYLCMEDEELWQPVFGYEYRDNEEFETAMKNAYLNRIRQKG